MRGGLLAAVGLAALAIGGPAAADTLSEALAQTYETNPTITAQRMQLRTFDEQVAIARAGLRPQVSATVGVNQDVLSTTNTGRNFNAGVEVSYPLFNAGSVRNQIRAADERVLGQRATLLAVTADVFTNAVAAYMDVIRDRMVVSLNQNQVQVLETNLQATRDRFEVGDLTRTDIAQSEARLAAARANLAAAEGRLEASVETYRQVIGELPGDLAPPPPLPDLPDTPEQAVDIALAESHALRAVAARVRAAGLDIDVLRAGRLPTVSAVSSGRYTNYLGTADEQFAVGAPNDVAAGGVGVQARIPLYQGGVVSARVRQAQAAESQLFEQLIETERQIIANTRAAFASYQAALEAIESNTIAVAANELALEGTRAEQTVGTRNVLDVLNAEQELLNSQVALVTARRDAYVAGFRLLNVMGQADVAELNLDGGYIYDPVAYYETSTRRASDWADSPDEAPLATRTVPEGQDSPIVAPLQTPVTEPRR